MSIKYVVRDRRTGRIVSRHIKLSNARKSAVKHGYSSNAVRIYTVNGLQIL